MRPLLYLYYGVIIIPSPMQALKLSFTDMWATASNISNGVNFIFGDLFIFFLSFGLMCRLKINNSAHNHKSENT